MEKKFQSTVDDFRVQYTLVIPENMNRANYLTEEEQKFFQELSEAYAESERLTNQADGYDYALSVSAGIIAGLIDSLFVGEWDFREAKKKANIEINNRILSFAKKDLRYIPWCEGVDRKGKWIPRDPNRLTSAVEFLEDKYKLPGDNDWKFKGSGISAASHHLDDFCHHPTLVGMICCILVQFTGNAKYHPANGTDVSLPIEVNDYGKLVSDKPFGKVFAGIINWFFTVAQTLNNQKGHLMSDMAGSISAVKGKKSGAGVPGTVMSTLKELSALPCFKDSSFAENLRKAYMNGIGSGNKQISLGFLDPLFEGATSKFDMRTETAVKSELKRQAIPICINEIVVRTFYFIRRFIEQMKNNRSMMDLDWKKLLPINNRTIVRMITISSGTFVVTDLGDAAIRAGLESGGDLVAFAGKFILRVNFVGVGRFTLAVGAELYMEARKGRMEIAITSGEVAAMAIEEKKVILETTNINEMTDKKIEEMKAVASEMENVFR